MQNKKKETYETPTETVLIKLTYLKSLMLRATGNKQTSWTRLLDEVLDILYALDVRNLK